MSRKPQLRSKPPDDFNQISNCPPRSATSKSTRHKLAARKPCRLLKPKPSDTTAFWPKQNSTPSADNRNTPALQAERPDISNSHKSTDNSGEGPARKPHTEVTDATLRRKKQKSLGRQPLERCRDRQHVDVARCSATAEFNTYRPRASSITLNRIRTSPGLSEKSINSAEHGQRYGRSLRTSPATADQGL